MNQSFDMTKHETPLVITAHDVTATEVPWTEHLEELRYRLWWCVATLCASACVAFVWSKALVAWLARPLLAVLEHQRDLGGLAHPVGRLVFTELTEALVVHVKVALTVGCLVSAPVIAYHAWQFVSIGLEPHERRVARQLIPWSALLFFSGAVFGYAVFLPQLIRVLLSFSSPSLQPLISVSKYFSFVIRVILMFGAAFELPLVMWGLARLGVVEPSFWREKRPLAIMAIFIVAAIITPGPDVASQCLVAIPLVLLYEASAWLSALGGRAR